MTTTNRLPKHLRETALVQFNTMQEFRVAAFRNRVPQLLTMPNGKRLKWTTKGESHLYDFPNWIPFWYDDNKFVKDATRRIMMVVVEMEYERRKEWVVWPKKSVTI